MAVSRNAFLRRLVIIVPGVNISPLLNKRSTTALCPELVAALNAILPIGFRLSTASWRLSRVFTSPMSPRPAAATSGSSGPGPQVQPDSANSSSETTMTLSDISHRNGMFQLMDPGKLFTPTGRNWNCNAHAAIKTVVASIFRRG